MKLGSLNEYDIQNAGEISWLKTQVSNHMADMGLVLKNGVPATITVSIEMEQK